MQIGLPGLLTIIFVIAKLGGYINWSWWLVFAPAWVAFLVGFALAGIMLLAAALDKSPADRRRSKYL